MDLPFSPPNSPTSTLTEANEFVLHCLEPLSVERPPSPVITRDLLDSLESPVIPPSGYLGPALEEYLDSHAFARLVQPCITLGPCPTRRQASSLPVASVPPLLTVSSTAMVQYRPCCSCTIFTLLS